MPDSSAYLRQQAKRHLQLAFETTDSETAKALRMIAEEYTILALELEAKEAPLIMQIKPQQG